MRKSQSLSINTIIIALLAIIVLILLVVILGGSLRKFMGNTSDCESVGGVCGMYDSLDHTKCKEGYVKHLTADLCNKDTNEPCCIPVKEQP
jgi:hypothetical protein